MEEKKGCSGCFTWILAIALVLFVVTIVNANKTSTPVEASSGQQESTTATIETVLPGSAREAVMNGELTMADIKHRADAIGWSTDAWQKWYYIANQTGTSMEAVEKAAAELNKRLGEEPPEFVESLNALGISLDEAKAMKPEELFEKVIYGLQEIED